MYRNRSILAAFILCCTVAAYAAPMIEFTAPEPWTTLRKNGIKVQFIGTKESHGETAVIRLKRISPSGEKTLYTKRTQISPEGNAFDLASYFTPTGGDEFYALEWEIKGSDAEGILAPFSYYTVSDRNEHTEHLLSYTPGDDITDDDLIRTIKSGDTEIPGITMRSTDEHLRIAASADDSLTVCLDPANSKTGFPVFSDRFITLSGKGSSFHYLDREMRSRGKTLKLSYSPSPWNGDMTHRVSDNIHIVTIPWHSLGILPEEGRRLGFALIRNGNGLYPQSAQKLIPASWFNVKLDKK
ncbi:MAG: hypothetical protein ACQEQV_10365 [Fibrobacterota bacterium]